MKRQIGILLVGHGTRSERGLGEFLRVADQVSRRAAPLPVEPALLEIAEPTIRSGLTRLIERGVDHVVIAPLLLFAAGHAQRDIPAAVAAALAELGAINRVTTAMAAHLGCHRAILELSARQFYQSLAWRGAVPPTETCLLLVGRGSGDDSASAEMHEFARLRSMLTPVAATEVAFLAMAQPALGDILPRLAAGPWRRIVFQPHLLLHGELYDHLADQIANIRCQHPVMEWIVTSYLACGLARAPTSEARASSAADELVTSAVLARCSEAGIRVVALSADR